MVLVSGVVCVGGGGGLVGVVGIILVSGVVCVDGGVGLVWERMVCDDVWGLVGVVLVSGVVCVDGGGCRGRRGNL